MEFNKARSYGADILRGLAILAVVAYHAFGSVFGYVCPWRDSFRDFGSSENKIFLWFYPITLGWAGVALFFVLSGFCIHFSFLRDEQFHFGRFFWRRFWRIYPAYIVALLVFAAMDRLNILSPSGAVQFVSHALFLHNFLGSTFFTVNPSFWSLATEVQLYLLFPLLLVLRARLGMKGTLLVTLLVGLLWRLVAVYLWGFPNHPVTPAFVSPLMTWFDWTLGAFVAERFFHGRRAFDARQVWLWLLLFLFVASTLFKPLLTLSFSLAAAAGAVALDAALQRSWRKNLWTTAFAFLGLISYSLYLWHQPLLIRASYHLAYFHGSPYLAWSVVVPLLVIGSWFSYYLLEKVGIRAGDKLWAFRDRCSRAFYHLHHWRVRGAAEGKFHWRWAWPFGKPYLREDLRLYSDGGGIGDELMCTPIFREIRRLNPDCHLTFISRYPAVFRSNPNLDAVEPFSAKAIRGAIQLTYGPAVPPRRQLITLMAECVGLKLEATQLDAPVMMPTPELGAKIGSFTKPLIVIQPQASRWTPNKQWPIESWTELIRMLTAEFEVVEVGQETLFSRPDFGERFHSFVGKTTIADFGWLIAQAAVFVGPVSGGMHFANAFQVRSVVIFGGYESPAGHQYPLMQAFFSDVPCAQCWLTTPCPYDRKCLSMIQPAEVFRTVRAAALDPLWLPS